MLPPLHATPSDSLSAFSAFLPPSPPPSGQGTPGAAWLAAAPFPTPAATARAGDDAPSGERATPAPVPFDGGALLGALATPELTRQLLGAVSEQRRVLALVLECHALGAIALPPEVLRRVRAALEPLAAPFDVEPGPGIAA